MLVVFLVGGFGASYEDGIDVVVLGIGIGIWGGGGQGMGIFVVAVDLWRCFFIAVSVSGRHHGQAAGGQAVLATRKLGCG